MSIDDSNIFLNFSLSIKGNDFTTVLIFSSIFIQRNTLERKKVILITFCFCKRNKRFVKNKTSFTLIRKWNFIALTHNCFDRVRANRNIVLLLLSKSLTIIQRQKNVDWITVMLLVLNDASRWYLTYVTIS